MEVNRAWCTKCGGIFPFSLLEIEGDAGSGKYVCYECMGLSKPSLRGEPDEWVAMMMAKHSRPPGKKHALPSPAGGDRSAMRRSIDLIIARQGPNRERPIEDLTDRIVDLVRATDILTEGPVK